jgi:hypothetical protein
MPNEHSVDGRFYSRTGRAIGNFEVNHLVLQPLLESRHALLEIPTSLILWIRDGRDCDFGKCVAQESAQVAGKVAKGIVAALCIGGGGVSRMLEIKGVGGFFFFQESGTRCRNKGGKGMGKTNFEAMDEAEKQCFLHPELCSCIV